MSRPSVDVGRVGVWYGGIDALPNAEAQRAAQVVEELGYGALWVAEAVGRDPFVSSALLLSATERLVIATGIANIYARDPMTMVAGQKTLAEAFPGRFLLGMGVSHAHLVSNLRRHDYSKPYSYMADYLSRMDEALFMAVGPEDDGGRVLAALGPRMLTLAATSANGAHPYFTTPEHTFTARQTMGDDALLAPEQMAVLDTDPDDDDLADGGSNRLVDAIVAWGTEAQIAARVAEHHEAGADHVCVQILQDGLGMPEEQWRRLAPILVS